MNLQISKEETFVKASWLFLRLIGFAYFFAFFSLWDQIQGLIGSQGILPASDYLSQFKSTLSAYYFFPTIAWVNCSDIFLQSIVGAGIIFSLLVIIDICSGPSLLILWILYLSLTTVSQVFLSFQWDALLLETGFLAIFLTRWYLIGFPWKKEAINVPAKIVLMVFRLLLFKLMFLSGAVKLLSNDPTWRDLTALTFHYYTQPLPTPLAWWAAQFPLWFSKLSNAMVFAIEILVPFFIFAPRKFRLIAALVLILFQLLIALTGNYAFFNLLTIALCLLLVDDKFLNRVLPKRFSQNAHTASVYNPRWLTIFASIMLALNCLKIAEPVLARQTAILFYPIEQFEIINSYGLFAMMTTVRQEIVVEGSNDGKTWKAYEFKYKPGNLRRPPPWIAPYQPRLDWQMWFAALSDYQSNPWFVNFMIRLAQGSKAVLSLLETNPFPSSPPKYLQAKLFNYYFTNYDEKEISKNWWKQVPAGIYMPPVTTRVR